MLSVSDKMKDVWEHNGKLFGYPECCIRSFSKWAGYSERPLAYKEKYEASPFHKTGYLPCEECLSKDASVVLEYISKNRSPELMDFPNGRKNTMTKPDTEMRLFNGMEFWAIPDYINLWISKTGIVLNGFTGRHCKPTKDNRKHLLYVSISYKNDTEGKRTTASLCKLIATTFIDCNDTGRIAHYWGPDWTDPSTYVENVVWVKCALSNMFPMWVENRKTGQRVDFDSAEATATYVFNETGIRKSNSFFLKKDESSVGHLIIHRTVAIEERKNSIEEVNIKREIKFEGVVYTVIPGHPELACSQEGLFLNVLRNKPITPCNTINGWVISVQTSQGYADSITVARALALAFIEIPHALKSVKRIIARIPTDCRNRNDFPLLEWIWWDISPHSTTPEYIQRKYDDWLKNELG